MHKMHFMQRPSKPRSHHCIILLLHTQSVRIAHISLGFASEIWPIVRVLQVGG